MGEAGGRIAGLDGLRAVCVTLVLMSHLPIALHSLRNIGWYSSFPDAGFLGVNVFFVLSGFLIAHRLLATAADDGSLRWRRFWVHRSARIMPALVVFLVVHAVYATFAGFPPYGQIGDEVLMVVSALFQFANYAIRADIDNLFDNGALWSLSVEGQFYLAAPALLWFLARRRAHVPAGLVVLVATIAFLSWHRSNVFDALGSFDTYLRTDTRIESILIGVAGAVAWMRTPLVSARIVRSLSFPALVVMVVTFVRANQWSPFIWHWGMTLFDVCALVVILALATGSFPLVRALEARPVAWVGSISYALYIWHVPIIQVLLRHGERLGDPVQGVMAVVASLAVAAASTRWIETPARRSRAVARLAGETSAA